MTTMTDYFSLKVQEVHPEVYAAFSMSLPTLVSLYWIYLPSILKQFPEKIMVAGLGCMIHFPWSFMLHMYRAYGSNAVTRTTLFKLDVSFIHLHCLCNCYAWDMKLRFISLIFHLFAIIHIWYVDPITNPECKKQIDIFAAVGIVLTSYPMRFRSEGSHILALLLWLIAFLIYSKRVIGDYSSTLFHVLLAGPQFLMMRTINLPLLK